MHLIHAIRKWTCSFCAAPPHPGKTLNFYLPEVYNAFKYDRFLDFRLMCTARHLKTFLLLPEAVPRFCLPWLIMCGVDQWERDYLQKTSQVRITEKNVARAFPFTPLYKQRSFVSSLQGFHGSVCALVRIETSAADDAAQTCCCAPAQVINFGTYT